MADAIAATIEQPAQLTRQMLAVLAADVVGYARLTESDEEVTHTRLRALRVNVIDPCVVTYRGRIVKNTGDGFLAVFDSAADAIQCAIELQSEVAESGRTAAPDRKIAFRMGLNFARAIVEPEDVYGMGVNVAARLEQLAPAGGILISAPVLDQLGPRSDLPMVDLGSLRLKHISKPVQAYSLLVPGIEHNALPSRPRSSRRARVPSVAVLPFTSPGGRGDDYFGNGIVEDIVVALQGVRGLLVIARASTLAFRKVPIDISRVGRELGVRYVLSGTVRRDHDQLRITVELADVQAGSTIWADRYDGQISDLFDFQARIATRIVWSVAPHVREAELKRALRKRPDNMNAYDLVMQAIDLMYRMNFADFTEAGTLLQRAIVADPSYATAYAYAALWHVHNVAQGWSSDADRAEAARLAAAAVDHDPMDSFALALLAHTKSFLFQDYDGARELFDRALAASPSNAMAWTLSSTVYSYTGDGRTAVERAQHGLRLSPLDTQAFFYLMILGIAHYVNGSYDEALIWLQKSVAMNPRLCASLRVLIVDLVALGKLKEARDFSRRLLEIQPRFRVSEYASLCPYRDTIRTEFLSRLVQAGLPE
ncbi:MAG TPA: adenylate/guanylate cyclase domain-containing protein [Blastocatellia bacterium]|nr:adenylate/guanylate cyclase domain-containing protein [Blastocatellia bacterium]